MQELNALQARWDKQRKAAEENYGKLLRKLHKSKIDGVEFIRLRQQVERLQPLQQQRKTMKRELKANEDFRRKILPEWEDLQSAEYRALTRAAREISKKLRGRVQVNVKMAGNIEPLECLLRNNVGGQLGPALERLKSQDELSLHDLAERCREGKEFLIEHYRLPPVAAECMAQASPDLFMKIEELELPATTAIRLNTAPEGEP